MIENKIDRRQFLRGAALAALAPAMMTSGLAACLRISAPRWKAAMWNGREFVPLGRPSGSLSGQVRVEISGMARSGRLRGVDLKVPVQSGDKRITVPFHAWTANSPAPTRFAAHSHAEEGLVFEILTQDGADEVSVPGLIPGTYVFAATRADMERVAHCRGWRGEISTAPAPCHVVVEISAA